LKCIKLIIYAVTLNNCAKPILAERCRAKAREGLWIFYKELVDGDGTDSEAAFEILERIETDSSRLEAFSIARRR
jgi:hypothetical protein